jgi:uncharacterized lipoprotein YmbA
MTRRGHGCAALLCATLLAGCASPPSRFYTLTGAPPGPVAAGVSMAVGPVSIPGVVDRPEIVVTVGANEVWLDEFNRWASPLGDAIALALVQDLSATLGSSRVTLPGQAAGGEPEYRVVIEVQRFESAPGSHALFDAAFSVRRTSDGATVPGRTTAREAVPEKNYDALAAAHSRALAKLAQDVTRALSSLPPAAPGRATPSPVR